MKKCIKWFVFLLMPILFSFSEPESSLTRYKPLLMKKAELIKSVFNEEAREFKTPGKIYIYSDRIFIVDLFSGVHVINNQDPGSPYREGFIHIPGVVDVAIQDNVLFADNAVDLVSVDISLYPQIVILDRVEDVFPEHTPPDLQWIPWSYSKENRPADTVIVRWEKK